MKLKIEIAIDVDQNRKIWIEASADAIEPEDVDKVSGALARHVVAKALDVHDHVHPPLKMAKDPEDIPGLQTFGEED